MVYQFLLPDIGEGTAEAEVVRWLVKEGDVVAEDQILLEIQSDKAMAELPSPVAGTIRKRHFNEGEMALVHKPICDIEVDADSPAKAVLDTPVPAANSAPMAPTTASPEPPSTPARPVASTVANIDVRHLAIPRVRKYARKQGVDLTAITGTGTNGKITIADIDRYLEGGQVSVASTPTQQGAPAASATPAAGIRREKMTAMRRATAKALTQTVSTVPVVTVLDRVEVEALVAHRKRLKVIAANRDISLTYTPYVVKACVAMLKRFPALNCFVDMEAGELCFRDTFHIGVATNTDHGLFVPVVRDAHRKSLFEIAAEITALGEKAKIGQLTNADMSDASLTITNVGGAATGGVWSTPIINAPESCIIGIGRLEEEFLPDENRQPVLKTVCKLSFAFDHRLVDGVTAQSAINTLKDYLHDPELLLAEG